MQVLQITLCVCVCTVKNQLKNRAFNKEDSLDLAKNIVMYLCLYIVQQTLFRVPLYVFCLANTVCVPVYIVQHCFVCLCLCIVQQTLLHMPVCVLFSKHHFMCLCVSFSKHCFMCVFVCHLANISCACIYVLFSKHCFMCLSALFQPHLLSGGPLLHQPTFQRQVCTSDVNCSCRSLQEKKVK